MNDLERLRRDKDEFFARDPGSPLTAGQKRTFEGLKYFPENSQWQLEVLAEPVQDEGPVEMLTSTGDVQTYRRVARFSFSVDGRQARLTIFEGEHGLFLPFVDSLAGIDTYPAGRYLEPEALPGGRYLVDFNLAYNPYCAYNERWSCPLTPQENRLAVPIRAGEKIYSTGR